MLRGHVDRVTSSGVSGWAADDEQPDRIIDISIFVDDAKIAQIACRNPRSDLAETGKYGSGAHGFSFDLTQALRDGNPGKVSVRFSETGTLVGNREFKLSENGTIPLPPPVQISSEIPATVPAPNDPRGTLNLFALFEPEIGLFPLLSRLDYGSRGPIETWYSAIGETIPAEQYHASLAGPYSPREDLYACLMSDRFQSNIVPIVLRAFPEKRRLIFVHVPKCAGTHLSVHLKQRLPSLDQGMAIPRWTSKEDLFERLSWFARLVPLYDSIFVSGHTQLRFYAENRLVRPSDHVFTVLRDPVDILISQLNYVLTRFATDSNSGNLGQDTKEWLHQLDLELPADPFDPNWTERVASRAVRNPNVIPQNPICYWLGQSTAETALNMLRLNSVEITDTAKFDQWMKTTWGIVSTRRYNESQPFFSSSSLPRALLTEIKNKVSEDLKLYGRVADALARSSTYPVIGRSL